MRIGIVGAQGYKSNTIFNDITKALKQIKDKHDLDDCDIEIQVIGGDCVSTHVMDFLKKRSQLKFRSHSMWLRADALPRVAREVDYALIFSPDSEDCLGRFIEDCKKHKVKRKVIA